MNTAENINETKLKAIDALCRLSERCQAVAKFSEQRISWYGKSELYVKTASNLMDEMLFQN